MKQMMTLAAALCLFSNLAVAGETWHCNVVDTASKNSACGEIDVDLSSGYAHVMDFANCPKVGISFDRSDSRKLNVIVGYIQPEQKPSFSTATYSMVDFANDTTRIDVSYASIKRAGLFGHNSYGVFVRAVCAKN